MSTCARKKVGCVLFDVYGRRVAGNYNRNIGNASCDHPELMGGCGCIHAEVAACAASRVPGTTSPYLAVQTLAPCLPCAKVLVFAGVREVWFEELSRPWPEARAFLERLHIPWRQVAPLPGA
jgi:deoxycytidylate deaminase